MSNPLKFEDHSIIPVVEIASADQAVPLAKAILAGGISILEVTLRTADGIEAIQRVRDQVPEMLVGAGTVITLEQSNQVRCAGAQFGVSPGFSPAIVDSFQADGLPFIPGVMTPTEIEAAMQKNCALLKFFPAGAAGGVSFLKALSGPYGNHGIRFCATGGITLNNMQDYLALPMVSAIGGSWLATARQIADGEWGKITQQAQQAGQQLQSGAST